MAEITGTISKLEPTDGSSFASGTTVDVKAQGTVRVPAAEGGVQDTYKVTIRVHAYNYESCLTKPAEATNQYTEVFVPETKTTSEAATTVSDDAYYRVTGYLVAQKQNPDGTYGPEVVLDRKTTFFKIDDPVDCAPRIYFCSDDDIPVNGCTAPSPADGSTVPPGQITLRHRVQAAVVGPQACSKKHHFVVKWEMAGPDPAAFTGQADIHGVGTAWIEFLLNPTVSPGEYTVTATATAQRTDSPKAECSQVQFLGQFSWRFTVAVSSSSSSSSSSGSSGSSQSSAPSSF